MNSFLVLFRKEMGALFLSPVAYILLAVYFILHGLNMATLFNATGYEVGETFSLFFGGALPYFWIIIITAPSLVTMRLFAEEKKQGTLEILLTAPVGDAEVVLAKFFAALTFYFLLWLPAPFFFLILSIFGGSAPTGPFLAGWFGVLLVGSLFSALGLLASTLTANQIIAAVLSFLGSLIIIFFPWISYFFPGRFLQRITSHISLSSHFHDFGRGLVDTGVLVFYFSLTAFLLFLSIRVVEARRWRA